jgi:hypothetical protein
MNPFGWSREGQMALVLAAVLGAPFGMLVGYFAYAVGTGAGGAISFGPWLFDWSYHPSRFFGWGAFGAIAGASFVYISRIARLN